MDFEDADVERILSALHVWPIDMAPASVGRLVENRWNSNVRGMKKIERAHFAAAIVAFASCMLPSTAAGQGATGEPSPFVKAEAAKNVFDLIERYRSFPVYDTLRSRSAELAKVDSFYEFRGKPPKLSLIPTSAELGEAQRLLDLLQPLPMLAPVAAPTALGGRVGGALSVATGAAAATALTPAVFQTAVINAVTDFIIDRAKQELVLAYLPSLTRRFDETGLGRVFPNARLLLSTAGHVDYRFLVPSLKVAFQKDMTDAPYELTELAHARMATLTPSRAAALRGGLLTFRAFRQVTDGTHPLKLLAGLDADPVFRNLLSGAPLFAASALAALASDTTFGASRLRALDDADRAWLVWSFSVVRAKQKFPLMLAQIQEWVDSVGEGSETVRAIGRDLIELRSQFATLSRTPAPTPANLLVALDAVTRGTKWLGLLGGDALTLDYRSGLTRGSEIARSVIQKQYGHAIILASATTLEIKCDTNPTCIATQGFVRRSMPVLTFAATVASADSAADVVRALNAAAAPVGSYRDKRVTRTGRVFSTVTLDSYVGFAVGREQLTPGGTPHDVATVSGFALPIGVELGRRAPFGNFSIGLLVSPIDLGAVATPRLSGREDMPEAEGASWAQLFAPAAYFVVGMPNSPLAAGLGFQAVPNARRDADTGKSHDALRARLFLAVNVVLFNLWQSEPAP